MQSFVRSSKDGLFLFVRVTPRSQLDEISGVEESGNPERLRVRLRALHNDGKANKSLCHLIAAWLGVSKSAVSLISGGTARNKKLSVRGEIDQLKKSTENRIKDLS